MTDVHISRSQPRLSMVQETPNITAATAANNAPLQNDGGKSFKQQQQWLSSTNNLSVLNDQPKNQIESVSNSNDDALKPVNSNVESAEDRNDTLDTTESVTLAESHGDNADDDDPKHNSTNGNIKQNQKQPPIKRNVSGSDISQTRQKQQQQRPGLSRNGNAVGSKQAPNQNSNDAKDQDSAKQQSSSGRAVTTIYTKKSNSVPAAQQVQFRTVVHTKQGSDAHFSSNTSKVGHNTSHAKNSNHMNVNSSQAPNRHHHPQQHHHQQHHYFPKQQQQQQQHNQHQHQEQHMLAGGKGQYRPIVTNTQPIHAQIRGAISPNTHPRSREGTIDSTSPLFERLFTSEETQDSKTTSRIISDQSKRLNELELVHDELQARLEEQTKARMALEAELDKCHRKWSERYLSLKNERDEWEKRVIDEQKKNEQLLKKINDKEKIILEMLQHKYDGHNVNQFGTHQNSRRRPGANETSGPSATPSNLKPGKYADLQFKSPREILSQTSSAETIRERNAANILSAFYGLPQQSNANYR